MIRTLPLVLLLGCPFLALAQAPTPPTEAALLRLEGRLGQNPYDPVALNNLAVIRANEGEWVEALALLDRASRFGPDHPVISANLGDLSEWMDRRLPEASNDDASPLAERLPPPPALWGP